ncbi:MAG: NUDIX hydrolase [Candidatus Zixiibacteriota bacterium]|nr:MAG: NUDIX hydrolase [candidate division Zixibacteria bacterium]
MMDKHKNFDADALFKRKDQMSGYRFCPLCGSNLNREKFDGRPRMVCTDANCDFVFYQNPIPAAGAIIVKDDSVLLVKRAHPPKVNWWCIPAGFMEWSEHPTDTAIREVEEETGLKIKLTSFFEVYSGQDDPRNNAVLMLYLADIVGGKMRASDDALEVRYFKFDDLPEKIAFISHRQALADYVARYRK